MVETGASGVKKTDFSAVTENIIPSIDDTFDLGSAAKRWAAIFVVLALVTSITIGGAIKLTTVGNTLIINDSTQIQGNLTIDNDLEVKGFLNVSGGPSNFTGNAIFDKDTLFVDSTNDRVGIGTASPGALLHLSGSAISIFIDALGGTTSSLRFRDGTVQSWRISRFDGPDDLRIVADVADLNVMTFRTSGNVGIGTITPEEILTVIGNGSFTENLTLSDDLIMDQDDVLNLGAGNIKYNGTCIIILGSSATLEIC